MSFQKEIVFLVFKVRFSLKFSDDLNLQKGIPTANKNGFHYNTDVKISM